MKTSLEKTGTLGRKLSIQVSAEKVSSAFDRVYKGIQKNANIKGFRKGKAPLPLIKKTYGDQVKHDVLHDLISEHYNSALDEHSLRPVTEPNVQFKSALDEAADFHFTAEFEVRPEITLKKIDKLKVEREQLVLDEKRIDDVLAQIRDSRAEMVPVLEDRAAAKGDTAEIDFDGFIDGAPLAGGSGKGHKLELGSNSFIPGFEDGVVGMKIGQTRDIQIKFPDDYHAEEIKGKPVKFTVTLKGLLHKRLPEITDEFAKTLGPFDTLEALKNTIREDLKKDEEKRIQDDLKSRILKVLVAENPVDVPASLLERQKELLAADVEKRLRSQGAADQDIVEYKTKWQKDLEDTAKFMVQSSFLIETIAEKEKLEATSQDFNDRLDKYAKQTGIDMKRLREYYAESGRAQQLMFQVMEEKVVARLIAAADIKDVPADKLAKG